MMDDNKRNVVYFEEPSMRSLYETIDNWQATNRKRLLSINIQRDGDLFCGIAVTNPTEVNIVDENGVSVGVYHGALMVTERLK
jgi:hypothetical protein